MNQRDTDYHVYEYEPVVDLGLSVKWASCNLGADSPEKNGNYYAWGEVGTKKEYNWQTYRWCKDAYDTQTKYNTKYEFGVIDYKIQLEKCDDAAYMQLGGKWRIPTVQEWFELYEKCIWNRATMNGIKGYMVTSRINNNSIFLPFSGFRYNDAIGDVGKFGFYWSSSLDPHDPDRAWSADLSADNHIMFAIMRYRGYSVRPVMDD